MLDRPCIATSAVEFLRPMLPVDNPSEPAIPKVVYSPGRFGGAPSPHGTGAYPPCQGTAGAVEATFGGCG